MANRDDIKKQIKRQDDEIYGESTISGSSPDPESDDNTREILEKTVGNKINPGDPFVLADEVIKDEKARQPGPHDAGGEEQEEEEEI